MFIHPKVIKKLYSFIFILCFCHTGCPMNVRGYGEVPWTGKQNSETRFPISLFHVYCIHYPSCDSVNIHIILVISRKYNTICVCFNQESMGLSYFIENQCVHDIVCLSVSRALLRTRFVCDTLYYYAPSCLALCNEQKIEKSNKTKIVNLAITRSFHDRCRHGLLYLTTN